MAWTYSSKLRSLVALQMAAAIYQRHQNPDSIIATDERETGMKKTHIARKYLFSGMLTFAALPLYVAPAAAQADFKGETVSIQIGYGPGGGYDTYGRALARHFGRFIPGNPNVVPKNMPGAGSLRAANYVYNLSARDPVDIALIAASTAVEPLMGNDAAKFDVTKFGWLGSMNQDISFCGVWQAQGLPNTFQEMLKKGGKELIFGSAGPAAISHQHPLILKNVLGANIRVISGYEGQKQVNLAMQRGEVHGACGLFVSSIKAQWMPNVKAGQLKGSSSCSCRWVRSFPTSSVRCPMSSIS
jgi:tripartite-type tricarboxylate transporter receptor subunit TctC